MQTQLTVLNNGLHVVSKKDETTGMFNIGVWCRCGSRFETPAQNGIAHFCEHMTFKGTTTRSELEINEQIADLGGKSNAWTDMDTTAFSIEVLNEDREAAIELLADILLNSTFTEANIDSERQVIFQEMYEDENDSDDCFNDAFSQLVYGSQPLGRDILGSRVVRPQCIETTALGAALLAGLAVGVWKNMDEIRRVWQVDLSLVPQMSEQEREKAMVGWHRAVRRSMRWAAEED